MKSKNVEYKELQDKIVKRVHKYSEYYGIEIDENYARLKLYEEVGEFAQALLIHDKKSRPEKFLNEDESKRKLSEELADIIGLAIYNAHVLDVDVWEALDRKWINRDD